MYFDQASGLSGGIGNFTAGDILELASTGVASATAAFNGTNTIVTINLSGGGTQSFTLAGNLSANSFNVANSGGYSEITLSAPGTLAGAVTLTSASEGVAIAAGTQVAVFTDTIASVPASNFTASITFGDGTTAAGTVTGSNGSFTVSTASAHTYADEGNEVLSATITPETGSPLNLSGTVTVGVNAPVLAGGGDTVSFALGGTAKAVDSALSVSDTSSATLSGATVSITGGFQSGDELNFTTQNGITASYANGVLTLTGSASLANYQTALNSITFSTTSTNTAARTVSWQASAGAEASNIVTSTVTVTPAATAISWKSPVSGNWNNGSYWSSGKAPTAANQANIAVSGRTYAVTINSSDVAQGLTLNAAGATVSDNKGGTLTLAGTGGTANPNGVFSITSGTFDLNGGALKAGSISTSQGGTLLIAGGVLYTGANSLAETITNNGAITVQSLAAADFTGAISGDGAITVQNLAAAGFGAISGSETVTVQNGGAASFGNVSGSEDFKVQSLGALTISGTVSGSESVSLTNGALAVIKGAVTDSAGSFSLANGATLEFRAGSNAAVTFGGGSNSLKLEDSKQFTGTISGLDEIPTRSTSPICPMSRAR